jgi:hypothetical protein
VNLARYKGLGRCLAKSSCLKALVLGLQCTGEHSGAQLSGRKPGHWGSDREEDIVTLRCLGYFSLSRLPRRKAMTSAMFSLHDVLFHHRPKSSGANEPRTETPKLSHSLILSCVSVLFCYGNGKLTHIPGFWIQNQHVVICNAFLFTANTARKI